PEALGAHVTSLLEQGLQRRGQYLDVRGRDPSGRFGARSATLGVTGQSVPWVDHGLTLGQALGTDGVPVAEPHDSIGLHSRGGDVFASEHLLHGVALGSSLDGEDDESPACYPGKGEREASIWVAPGRVETVVDESVLRGVEHWRVREQRGGVAVWPHPEMNEVKPGTR